MFGSTMLIGGRIYRIAWDLRAGLWIAVPRRTPRLSRGFIARYLVGRTA